MPFPKSYQQQQILYLAITLGILVLAVSLVQWQEHHQNKIADQITTQQLILFESSRIKQELVQVYFHTTDRSLAGEKDSRDASSAQKSLYGARFNLSVSLYTIRSQLDKLILLLQESGSQGRLPEKLSIQLSQFKALEPLLRSGDEAGIQKTHLPLQAIALSIEQLEGLHYLEYQQLNRELDAKIRQDNWVLIGFLSALVVISYLLIRWTSELIRKTQDRFTAELETKNSELERFVYTVSHDLRTPLVTIKGFVGLLQKNIAADNMEKVREDFERINRAADDMAELLSGLLELSRIGRVINPPVSGSLGILVGKVVDKMRGLISQHGITLVIDENMPTYWGDELRISEVFQNLIENAIKFMGDQPAPRIRVSAILDGHQVVCVVEDNGIGIDPRYQNRVFNLFERLNLEIEGTGIGLSIVKRIVEAHGGTIRIESEGVERGCQFIFTLPTGPDGEIHQGPD